jgi:hypothetical protein
LLLQLLDANRNRTPFLHIQHTRSAAGCRVVDGQLLDKRNERIDGNAEDTPKKYLMVSDFDQTLSFNDSGIVLSELLGVSGFTERINGLSTIHLVQQGGELAYLLLHDPEYRRVRREHLVEVGKRIRLKQNIRSLSKLLASIEGYSFHSTWSPPLRGK